MSRVAFIVIMALIAILCFAGCAATTPTPSWQPTAEALLKSPQPAVDFIDYLDPYPGQTGPSSGNFCMSINPEAIYEAGDYKRDFDKKWQTLFQLTLDRIPISVEKMSFSYNLTCGAATDNRCALINRMGCVQNQTLTKGFHIATLQATSMSGKVSTYTWAFRVDSIVDNSDRRGFSGAFMDRIANGQLADPFAAKWATDFPYLVKTPMATEAH